MTVPISVGNVPAVAPTHSNPVTDGSYVTLIDNARSNAFPSILNLGDGEFLVGYREAYAHSQQTGALRGRIWAQRTTDYGDAFGSPFTIYDHGVWDARDPCFSTLSDGTHVCTFFMFEDNSAVLDEKISHGPYYMTSPAGGDGSTWSAPVHIGDGWDFKAQNSCPVVEAGGFLMVGTYGKDVGETYLNTGVWVAEITTTVAAALTGTWTFVPLSDTDGVDSDNPNEPRPGLLDDGTFVAFQRHTGIRIARLTAETPLGPWSEATPVIGTSGAQATGRPTWIKTQSGKLLLGYRGHESFATFSASLDGTGTSWTTPTQVDPDPAVQMTYIDFCEVEPGWIAMAYGIENGSGNSDILLRYLRDGAVTELRGEPGMSPRSGGRSLIAAGR
jgi:hypothetical protein